MEVDALIDGIAGVVLTHLSVMAGRCSRDMVFKRNIDAAVIQIGREMIAASAVDPRSPCADDRQDTPARVN